MRLITIAVGCLIAGCASLPPREVYVAWSTPCSGPDIRRVQFVDTQVPVLACVQASLQVGDGTMLLMTLMGVPPAACAITFYRPGYLDTSTIYAPISPTPSQIAAAIGTLRPPEDLLVHEIEHAFGNGHWGCE